MSKIVIFAGPSLGAAELAEMAAFDCLPPAALGDVYRAAAGGARMIGLIDGYFEGVPAVWHKEILFALAQGVHVFGAASMGALRAAELGCFGMRGVGRIHDWYACGAIEADDEVALVHGPPEAGFMALSEPLVNIRATLEKAREENVVSAELAAAMLAAAAGLFYKERSWESVLARLAPVPAGLPGFEAWLPRNRIDQKNQDARAMIEMMIAFLAGNPPPFVAEFVFQPTHAWNAGVAEFQEKAELSNQDRLLLDEARLLPDQFRRLAERAALVVLTRQAGVMSAKPADSARLVDNFRIENGLLDSRGFHDWQSAHEIADADLDGILSARAHAAASVAGLGDALLREIVNEIKLGGLYRDMLERAGRKAKALAPAGLKRQLPLHVLLEWYFEQRLGQAIPRDLDACCRQLMLADRRALQELLAREFICDRIQS